MLRAPGMWPGLCACSCGRWGGASSSPRYSSGERTSTSPKPGLPRTLVVYQSTEGADLANGPGGLISGDRSDGGLVRRQRAPLKLPLLAAPVHQLDRLVAVILEVPVRVGGEPV